MLYVLCIIFSVPLYYFSASALIHFHQLISLQQVAHIPGALFFDVDGIADRTTNVRQFFDFYVFVYVHTKHTHGHMYIEILNDIHGFLLRYIRGDGV